MNNLLSDVSLRSEPQIWAIGEALIEFNQMPESRQALYLQGFGGDTSNFLIAAARQGANVGYISRIGNDEHGRLLQGLWQNEGINTEYVQIAAGDPTGVYFVRHDSHGHHFSFLRKNSAASKMDLGLLDKLPFAHMRLLHFSGISLAISASARKTTLQLVREARKRGVLISFDTNLRLSLWSLNRAKQVIDEALGMCDFCLPGLEDMQFLKGNVEPDRIIEDCLGRGAKVVALKMGNRGAIVANQHERYNIKAFPCQPIDATGAGDAFDGAFIARILAGDHLRQAGEYAAIVAALSTQSFGAVNGIPHQEEVWRHADKLKAVNSPGE